MHEDEWDKLGLFAEFNMLGLINTSIVGENAGQNQGLSLEHSIVLREERKFYNMHFICQNFHRCQLL